MDPRRNIPAVDRLLNSAAFAGLATSTPRALLVSAIQSVQSEVRASADATPADTQSETWYAARVTVALDDLRGSTLRRVINATGVVLHTNLGRAPLAQTAIDAMQHAATGYNTLEYDVVKGKRSSRYDHCARLLRHLTDAEDALVVNNNAAALVLMLNTFARGREAIVSRGELVEIGGSFRVPDIMARSSARLREAGSTNRTHLQDYEEAITPRTGAIVKVHRSNFSIEGFTSEVSVAELAKLASAHGIPLLYDLGSGLLSDAAALGFDDEPTARDAIHDGATVVALSGDKLLGGPQAGILIGDSSSIAAMRRNPLCRALRVDKITLAALEATLLLHLDPDRARTEIPALRMLTLGPDTIGRRAQAIADALTQHSITAFVCDGSSAVGGGAAPGRDLPTRLLSVTPAGRSAATVERRLRALEVPVIARIENNAVLIDLRTVSVSDDIHVTESLLKVLK